MSLGLIGRKIGMTQIFNEDGIAVPVTVIETGPCTITQIKDKEKDGYEALQLGFIDDEEKNLTKPELGKFKKNNLSLKRYLKEFKVNDVSKYKLGDILNVSDIFSENDFIDVRGRSKGKGFQGVVKRHGFHGGRKTHGSNFHRAPGSIGNHSYPAKVFKNRKLPGRTGFDNITIQNLKVVSVDNEKNLLLIRGAIPGPNNGIVTIRKAVKKAGN